MRTLLLASLLVTLPLSAEAAACRTPLLSYDAVRISLGQTYHETPAAFSVSGPQTVYEIWTSAATGFVATYSVLQVELTSAGKRACLVANGKFRPRPQPVSLSA